VCQGSRSFFNLKIYDFAIFLDGKQVKLSSLIPPPPPSYPLPSVIATLSMYLGLSDDSQLVAIIESPSVVFQPAPGEADARIYFSASAYVYTLAQPPSDASTC
jgi:hypothetical protein